MISIILHDPWKFFPRSPASAHAVREVAEDRDERRRSGGLALGRRSEHPGWWATRGDTDPKRHIWWCAPHLSGHATSNGRFRDVVSAHNIWKTNIRCCAHAPYVFNFCLHNIILHPIDMVEMLRPLRTTVVPPGVTRRVRVAYSAFAV